MYITQINSTNTYLLELLKETPIEEPLFTVYTFDQTAGRGQAGNSWESEPGKNLLFTTLFDMSSIPADKQFTLSMLVPLTIVEYLTDEFAKCGTPLNSQVYTNKVSIKWPNDIYYGDDKLCGILIEGVIAGNRIDKAIAGVGLNINQEVFVSNAPNPISLRQITGREWDLDAMMAGILAKFRELLPLLADYATLKQRYMAHLYRYAKPDSIGTLSLWKEVPVGVAPMMITREVDDTCFRASIQDVDDQGRLVLRREDGTLSAYHFKQIKYVFE